MTTTAPASSAVPLSERVWDGTLNDKELINYWMEQERQRVAAGGKTYLEGEQLSSYRQAAAKMIPLHL